MQTPYATASLPTFNKSERCTKTLLPLTRTVHAVRAVRFQGPQGQRPQFFGNITPTSEFVTFAPMYLHDSDATQAP